MNPYQGCEHGCIYCYARTTHDYWGYNAGLDFERKILYKSNAVELLKKQLNSKRWKPSPIFLSGNTDCYQPIEKKLQLTRDLLKVLLEYKHPVRILTKNSLIERDIDILSELAKLNLVSTAMSFTSLDNKLRSNLEPRTSSAKNKLKTIEKLANNNIPIQILIGPVIPGLNSHEVPDIIEQTANAGANWAGHTIIRVFGATLIVFEDWMEKTYPNQKNKVMQYITGANKKTHEAAETSRMITSLVNISRNKHMKKPNLELETSLFSVPKDQLTLF